MMLFDRGRVVIFSDSAPSVKCDKTPYTSNLLPRGKFYISKMTPVGDKYEIALYPVSRHGAQEIRDIARFEMTLDEVAIKRHFDARVVHTSMVQASLMEDYVRGFFEAAGQEEIYQKAAGKWGNYVRSTTFTVINQMQARVDEETLHNLVVEALMEAFSEDAISRYDESKGGKVLSFFVGAWYKNRLINKVDAYVKQSLRETELTPEHGDGEGVDRGVMDDESNDFRDIRRDDLITRDDNFDSVVYEELISGLRDYLGGMKNKNLLQIFDLAYNEGLSSNEIGERLGVKKARVSQLMKVLKQSIADYAKKIGNDKLQRMMMDLMNKRRTFTKLNPLYDDQFEIADLFRQIRAAKFVNAELPSGQVVQLQRKHVNNRLEEKFTSSDLNMSDANLDRMSQDMFREMLAADDVVATSDDLVMLTRMGESGLETQGDF